MNIEIVETTDIIIYPNPAKNILVLECTENHKSSGTIYIYNYLGSIVKSMPMNNISSQTIDISVLKAGLYFLRVKTGSSIITKKFTKNY